MFVAINPPIKQHDLQKANLQHFFWAKNVQCPRVFLEKKCSLSPEISVGVGDVKGQHKVMTETWCRYREGVKALE